MKLFFSKPNILNESSLVNQEVRVKNNNKTLGELIIPLQDYTSQLSLLSVVTGSNAVSHFPFTLLSLLFKKLTQESNIHILRPLAKIKGETAIIKGGKTGKIFQKQERKRTMVSTANSNVKASLVSSRYGGTPVWGIKKPCSVCAPGALGAG